MPTCYVTRATLLIALSLATACVSSTPPPISTTATATPSDTGYVETLDGVRLYYRAMGGRQRDTIVVIHGGPGFTLSYLADDLAPLCVRYTATPVPATSSAHTATTTRRMRSRGVVGVPASHSPGAISSRSGT